MLLDENGGDGVILGAVYSSVDKPPVNNPDARGVTYSDSAAFYYDRKTHTLTINGGIEHIVIACGTDVTVKTQRATIDAPEMKVTGNLLVKGKLTYQGGMAGSGGADSAATIQGNVSVQGDIDASGKVMDKGGNSNHHSH